MSLPDTIFTKLKNISLSYELLEDKKVFTFPENKYLKIIQNKTGFYIRSSSKELDSLFLENNEFFDSMGYIISKTLTHIDGMDRGV